MINATPNGMAPASEHGPVNMSKLSDYSAVMDVVAYPPVNRMVKEARNAGLIGIDGFPMSIFQATAQFHIYTGHPPPVEAIQKATETLLPQH